MYYQKELTTHAKFVERVSERIKTLGISIPQIAQLSDIKESTLKNILYKEVEISRTALVSLAFALETTVEYLAVGVKSSESKNSSDSITLVVQTPENLAVAEGFRGVVPRQPSLIRVAETIPIPKSVILSEGVNPNDVRAVEVNHDRLRPDLMPGDVALVDVNNKVLAEGYFVIAIRDAVVLRFAAPSVRGFILSTFSHHVGGTLVAINEDGTYSDPEVKVIGRVFSCISLTKL